ncbi:zinc-binding dehydrogenase [Actinomadura decatromicini]|uniref:Alcohol dehydrogenase catalytic domain-containing protein n=1 Tax=Actinomadura decatromicini TaxID=2604572 RepID=A0A5D3FSB2_9ACTN|nr:alcohol dehydrogenase catalytic domain-containing protein [Actinomadura decatromicini]TYK50984.1 alcohol dehydrogenase catalytic domain-containing protein [Actinomadura decatromicini]
MRATLIYGRGDVRVEDVPDPAIVEPTDAVVRVTRACVCGSDLHRYRGMDPVEEGLRIGHEFMGVVEDTGADVRGVKRGDVVLVPFLWADNTCEFCRDGLHGSCRNGGRWAVNGLDGGQGEAARVPQADGTLIRLPVGPDDALVPSIMALSDVLPTGHHAAFTAGVGKGSTVAVIGDGAVGLCAVLSAARLGAERIVLLGRHDARTDLGRRFGATDVVPARGAEAVAALRELTGGDGAPHVLECVGNGEAFETALGGVRDGGTISRVGVPQYAQARLDFDVFMRNITITGGVAPARQYIPELLSEVLDGTITPGDVFDLTVPLDDISEGFRAMNERTALKALVRP